MASADAGEYRKDNSSEDESSQGDDATIEQLMHNSDSENPAEFLAPIKDGGGSASNADWTIPRETDKLSGLRDSLVEFLKERQLITKCCRSIAKPAPGEECEPRFSPSTLRAAQCLVREFLSNEGIDPKLCNEGVEPGQPFYLGLLQGLLAVTDDVDIALVDSLREGVVTGIDEWIAPSGVWETGANKTPSGDVRDCDSNWSDDSPLLGELVSMELKNGFLVDAYLQLEKALLGRRKGC